MSKDYLYIRAWGLLMGSKSDYIEEEVKRARAENAPADAIFRNVGNRAGTWDTYQQITREDTRQKIDAYVERFK